MIGNQSHSRSESWFARQLRDTARLQRPEFSESLHDRVMRAIRPPSAVRPARRRGWQIAWWTSVAAAIVGVALAGNWVVGSKSHDGASGSNLAVVKPVKSSPEPTGSNASPVRAALAANYTLDDLSRDARATAHILVDQLPFETPADDLGL